MITTQIELSLLIEKVHGISAGIISLHDVVNINKQTRPGELTNFFMVMEVYGHAQDKNFTGNLFDSRNEARSNDNGKDDLSLFRVKSLDQLTQVTFSIGKTIKKLNSMV